MSLDNYPPGAANDSSAPYNEKAQYGIEFNCIATQTLTMTTKISTDQYISEEDWDDCLNCRCESYDTSEVNWSEEFDDMGIGIPDLLEELKKRLTKEMAEITEDQREGNKKWRYRRLQYLAEACGAWKLEDQIVEEE